MNNSEIWLPQGRFSPRRYRPGGLGNWSGHLPFARDLVEASRPQLLVELGTHYGESYFGFCQSVAENNLPCKCYAVDTWVGEQHAGFYDESVFHEVNSYNDVNYRSFSFLLRTTFDEARKNFSNDSIDILHIDGLHTYGAVRHDFDNWLSAVKPGGIVLLHDTSVRHADFGVWKVWEELEKSGESFAFSHNWGLGVYRKPGGQTAIPLFKTLFSADEDFRNHIRHFYSLCGRSLEYENIRAVAPGLQGSTALLQVFPEREEGYTARVVYDVVFKTKEWQHLRVDINAGSLHGGLRIDITEYPGVIDVAGITVRKAVNDEQVFQATSAEKLASLSVGGTLTRLDNKRHAQFCRYVSSGNDPQIFLQLDPGVTDQPLILDLWVRVDFDVTALLSWLTDTGDQELDKRLSEMQSNLDTHLATIKQLEAHQKVLSHEAELLRKERESLTSAHARTQGELYVLKRDMERTSNGDASSQAELNATLAALTSEHQQLQTSYQAVERSRAELEATVQGIMVSRSWRLTSPIRKIMGR